MTKLRIQVYLVDVVREQSDVDSAIWIVQDLKSISANHPEESSGFLDVHMVVLEGKKVSRISVDDSVVLTKFHNSFITIFIVDDLDGVGTLDQLALWTGCHFLSNGQFASCVSIFFGLKIFGKKTLGIYGKNGQVFYIYCHRLTF